MIKIARSGTSSY